MMMTECPIFSIHSVNETDFTICDPLHIAHTLPLDAFHCDKLLIVNLYSLLTVGVSLNAIYISFLEQTVSRVFYLT